MHRTMKRNLNGMFWDITQVKYQSTRVGGTQKAIDIFRQNLTSITWNSMSVLEQNPATLKQTAAVLQGKTVPDLGCHDLKQIQNYGAGARKMVDLLAQEQFELNIQTVCALHNCVG